MLLLFLSKGGGVCKLVLLIWKKGEEIIYLFPQFSFRYGTLWNRFVGWLVVVLRFHNSVRIPRTLTT
jgi:hypothetical protein